jgi:hypothetical protein
MRYFCEAGVVAPQVVKGCVAASGKGFAANFGQSALTERGTYVIRKSKHKAKNFAHSNKNLSTL